MSQREIRGAHNDASVYQDINDWTKVTCNGRRRPVPHGHRLAGNEVVHRTAKTFRTIAEPKKRIHIGERKRDVIDWSQGPPKIRDVVRFPEQENRAVLIQTPAPSPSRSLN